MDKDEIVAGLEELLSYITAPEDDVYDYVLAELLARLDGRRDDIETELVLHEARLTEQIDNMFADHCDGYSIGKERHVEYLETLAAIRRGRFKLALFDGNLDFTNFKEAVVFEDAAEAMIREGKHAHRLKRLKPDRDFQRLQMSARYEALKTENRRAGRRDYASAARREIGNQLGIEPETVAQYIKEAKPLVRRHHRDYRMRLFEDLTCLRHGRDLEPLKLTRSRK